MSYSIIVPSRNIANLTACVRRLREMGEHGRVIVVWDGDLDSVGCYLEPPISLITGVSPFAFARNVNIGIRAAGNDDVVLLGDDCLLETSRGLSGLFNCGLGVGVVSPQVRGPAHPAHAWAKNESPRLAQVTFVPFACVAITRRCIAAVGMLDEQFAPGSYEDMDYCHRVIDAGISIVVDRTCVVDHQTLPHTFRPAGKPDTYDLVANRKRYEDKWRGK
jgi:GT2 family glycosyltransferase